MVYKMNAVDKPLTTAQRNAKRMLVEFHREYDCWPTVREFADYLGIASSGSLYHLRMLEHKGHIQRTGGKSRMMKVLIHDDE